MGAMDPTKSGQRRVDGYLQAAVVTMVTDALREQAAGLRPPESSGTRAGIGDLEAVWGPDDGGLLSGRGKRRDGAHRNANGRDGNLPRRVRHLLGWPLLSSTPGRVPLKPGNSASVLGWCHRVHGALSDVTGGIERDLVRDRSGR